MKNIFNSILLKKPKSSTFDLSHDLDYSFNMGELIPTMALECIPGDRVRVTASNFMRFAPLVSPQNTPVYVTTDYYFVPNRLLWSEWDKFITGDSTAEHPFLTVGVSAVQQGSLADYLGIPPGDYGQSYPINVFQFAAYLKVFDEYYRDQNLMSEFFVPLVAGNNSLAYDRWFNDRPLRRAWNHDYFTSALPFAQKGDEVQIPLVFQDNIPVEMNPDNSTPVAFRDLDGGSIGTGNVTQDAGPVPFNETVHVNGDPVIFDPQGRLVVDVQAEAASINDLRRAYRLQEWLEKNARAGTRYVENILAHFGVKSSDARLQRPEFIGRMKQNMVISEVLSTAQETAENIPIGTMAGHGISAGGGQQFNYFAEEHGFIVGIVNVQPITSYMQGIHKSFFRFDKLDYAWPTFANLGEQEVLQRELFAQGAEPQEIFGYLPRYAEYKFMNSRVAGDMRNNLDTWHLARKFAEPPVLSEEFVTCNPDNRIFAVTDPNEDHVYAHIRNHVTSNRRLPYYGTPTI